jgi:hypothetical protein
MNVQCTVFIWPIWLVQVHLICGSLQQAWFYCDIIQVMIRKCRPNTVPVIYHTGMVPYCTVQYHSALLHLTVPSTVFKWISQLLYQTQSVFSVRRRIFFCVADSGEIGCD